MWVITEPFSDIGSLIHVPVDILQVVNSSLDVPSPAISVGPHYFSQIS